MDIALVAGGVVTQVWRDDSIARLTASGVSATGLVEFAPGAAICGMTWDGTSLAVPGPSTAALITYAYRKQESVMAGGVTISGVPVSTSQQGLINLNGAWSLAQLNPSQTFNWVTDSGPVSLNATQITNIAQAVGLWVQSTYTALGSVIDGINGATITSFAQIDAAAWPSNS